MAHYKPPKGKVSPLDPGKQIKKKEAKERKAARDKVPLKGKKKPPAKKPPAKKPPPTSKTVVKKTPSKVVGTGVGAGRIIGGASRLAGWAGLAYLGLEAAAPVFRHLFPKKDPATISPNTKRIQRLMSKTIGSRKGAGTKIMGGDPSKVGQQKEIVKPKEAVSLMPSPVSRPSAKKKLGQNKPRLSRGENLRGIAPAPAPAKKANDKKPVTERLSTPVKKASVVRVESASASELKVPKVVAKTTDRFQPASKRDSAYKGMSREQVRITEDKSPVAKKRITKDFDTTMGVYGWNNLTNSFGYLGTEKEVGKYGASTYFTEGFRRGSRIEGYKNGKLQKKKKKA